MRRDAQDRQTEQLPTRSCSVAQHGVNNAPTQQPDEHEGEYPGELAVGRTERVGAQTLPQRRLPGRSALLLTTPLAEYEPPRPADLTVLYQLGSALLSTNVLTVVTTFTVLFDIKTLRSTHTVY